MYEENESTLWLTTSGCGVCKVILGEKDGKIVANSVQQFILEMDKRK